MTLRKKILITVLDIFQKIEQTKEREIKTKK